MVAQWNGMQFGVCTFCFVCTKLADSHSLDSQITSKKNMRDIETSMPLQNNIIKKIIQYYKYKYKRKPSLLLLLYMYATPSNSAFILLSDGTTQ